ncbi:MAG TPA: 50S ribosomal protein L24 [Candidatus Paceibacterota bacterium]|jgi:large subunit ribosomal protein L24|nr:50S ribosomal protein L24 [Candidatus Paceibacterota bacterium]
MKLKKGDNVIVIAGKNKGEKGKIMLVNVATSRVIVEGVNKTKRHIKPASRGEKGSTVEKESALHISNVMLIDDKSGKGTRVGKKVVNGKNVRFAKKSGNEVK